MIVLMSVSTILLIGTNLLFVTSSSLTLKNPSTDSILDIINTKEVERLLAEKRENDSKEEKRYLIDNDLNENYISPEQMDLQKLKLFSDEGAATTTANQMKSENARIDIETFLRRNNKFSDPYRNPALLEDLRGYNSHKLLKSSKNALFVTKKEYLQRDWCKTEPLIQKVKEEGCLTRTVINRFCYGQCNSFYIPKNPKKRNRKLTQSEEVEDEDLNGPAFKSCAFCKPSKFTWVTITLRCPSLTPNYRKKRIQRIKQCKCTAANVD